MILIDSDIAIDLLRGHPPAIVWALALAEPMTLTGFGAMELVQGCGDKKSLSRTRDWIDRHRVLWPGSGDCRRALERFGERRLRFGLNASDALIAETAIGAGVPLHTFNTRHFVAYGELITVQPYTR